jgi:hypothetical protein
VQRWPLDSKLLGHYRSQLLAKQGNPALVAWRVFEQSKFNKKKNEEDAIVGSLIQAVLPLLP